MYNKYCRFVEEKDIVKLTNDVAGRNCEEPFISFSDENATESIMDTTSNA